MTNQKKREKVIALLERYVDIPNLAGVENYGDKIVDMPAPLIADALALLKAQEPRVMTEQEMRDAEPGAVIYCEQRDEVRTYLTPLIKYDDGVFENRFLGAEPEATQLPNVRFWTSRPTDEQREATPWH